VNGEPLAPLVLRSAVIKARAEFRAGRITYPELTRVAETYIDACAARFAERWPGKKFRRPSVGYVLRAL
jgi:hypothetical protein